MACEQIVCLLALLICVTGTVACMWTVVCPPAETHHHHHHHLHHHHCHKTLQGTVSDDYQLSRESWMRDGC